VQFLTPVETDFPPWLRWIGQALAVLFCIYTGRVSPLGEPWVPNLSLVDGGPAPLSTPLFPRVSPRPGLAPAARKGRAVRKPRNLPTTATEQQEGGHGPDQCQAREDRALEVAEDQVVPGAACSSSSRFQPVCQEPTVRPVCSQTSLWNGVSPG
jgi:hypothetical protein